MFSGGAAAVSDRALVSTGRRHMVDNSSDSAIPANIRDAFDQAVNELIAWDKSGEEPTVSFDGNPTPISTIARLAETYKDTMPTGVFWRLVNYANRSRERKAAAVELSKDSSYATGAWCLLQWIVDI
jgi:hypothetical protein